MAVTGAAAVAGAAGCCCGLLQLVAAAALAADRCSILSLAAAGWIRLQMLLPL